MTYTVQMVKSPNLSPEECERRLAMVYQFLLDLARREETDDDAGDPEREATEAVRRDE